MSSGHLGRTIDFYFNGSILREEGGRDHKGKETTGAEAQIR